MTATREAPAEIENITGEFKGSVSKRGNFQTQQLEYTADDKWLGITAIAERYSRQASEESSWYSIVILSPARTILKAPPHHPWRECATLKCTASASTTIWVRPQP